MAPIILFSFHLLNASKTLMHLILIAAASFVRLTEIMVGA